jgi:hypothetical protein
MLRKLLQVLLATVFVHGAAAEVADLKPGHPTRYVVKQGDTLWDIASTFLHPVAVARGVAAEPPGQEPA